MKAPWVHRLSAQKVRAHLVARYLGLGEPLKEDAHRGIGVSRTNLPFASDMFYVPPPQNFRTWRKHFCIIRKDG